MALEYAQAGKPVLFLEHDIDAPQGNRIDRWWDSYPGTPLLGVPLIMVDSGYGITCGPEDFRASYRSLVDPALERPAGARIDAFFERDGHTVRVTARVTNLSGTTLSSANFAAVNAMVWEKKRVLRTDYFVRSATFKPINTDLAHGQSADYTMTMTYVGVDKWDQAQVVAMVDYRPDPASSAYEMLQAVVAVEDVPPTITPTVTDPPTHTPTPPDTPTPIPDPEQAFVPYALRSL